MTAVYLETGKRKVFACARDWPGWARPGRDELAALAAAAPRFALVCASAGIPFGSAAAAAGFEIVERVTGSTATDFGALDVCADLDRASLSREKASRLVAPAEAAWNVFGQVAGASPGALRKGPRGGGRALDAIVDHVLQTEVPGTPSTTPGRFRTGKLRGNKVSLTVISTALQMAKRRGCARFCRMRCAAAAIYDGHALRRGQMWRWRRGRIRPAGAGGGGCGRRRLRWAVPCSW